MDSYYLRKKESACTFFRIIIDNKFKEFPFGEKANRKFFLITCNWKAHTKYGQCGPFIVLSILTHKDIPICSWGNKITSCFFFCLTTSSHTSPAARQASVRRHRRGPAWGDRAPRTWLHSNSIYYLWLFVCFYSRMSQKTIWF